MKEWRCFHCDDVYTDEAAAREHFGVHQAMKPLCQDRGTYAELLKRLRLAENENWRGFRRQVALEHECDALASQLSAWETRFPGCRTPQDVFNRYDSMEGRALAAEERLGQTVSGEQT